MSEALPEFTIERVFDAPLPLVWRAWTDPALLSQWMDPGNGSIDAFDLRPGGLWLGTTPGEPTMFSHFEFVSIEPESKLVWRHSFGDGEGGIGTHPMAPDWPRVLRTTVTFEADSEQTRVKLHWVPIDPTEAEIAMFTAARDGMAQGWGGSFDQLAETLAGASLTGSMYSTRRGETELVVLRYLAAPPKQVFAAHTDPDLVPRWCTGPEDHQMPVCEIDLRPGGKGRYVWTGADDFRMTLLLEFVEVDPPHRVVHLEHFDEDWAPAEWARVTTSFAPCAGGTLLEMVIDFIKPENREGALGFGMVGGMEVGYARLDAWLTKA